MFTVRILTVSALVAAASLAGAAQAAPADADHHPALHAGGQAELAKRVACEKVWAAQKVRHGTRRAFVAACVAKG